MMPGIALFTYTNLMGFAVVIIADCVVFSQRKADTFVFMASIVVILFVFVIIFSLFKGVYTLLARCYPHFVKINWLLVWTGTVRRNI